MKRILAPLSLLLCLPLAGAHAADGIVIGGGTGTESSEVARLGVIEETGRTWLASDRGQADLYVEAGMHHWNDGNDDLTGLSVVPTVVYRFKNSQSTIRPLVEYGVGFVVNNHTSLGDHELSTKFQFENRLGIGLQAGGQHRAILRASHASNGGLGRQNDGFDAVTLNYQYRW